jgi:hypothetical protein
VVNCPAYDSSFERPLAVKPSSIIEWMLCQKSWLFIFDTVESLSNDAQKYNFFQNVAIGSFFPWTSTVNPFFLAVVLLQLICTGLRWGEPPLAVLFLKSKTQT